MSKAGIVGLKSTGITWALMGVVAVLFKLLGISISGGTLFGTMSVMLFAASAEAYRQGVKDSAVNTRDA